MLTDNRILWLGGGSAAGKSTIGERLAEEFGFTVLHCDDLFNSDTSEVRAGTAAHFFRQLRESDDAVCNYFELDFGDRVQLYLDWGKEKFDDVLQRALSASETAGVVVEGTFEIQPELLEGRVDPDDVLCIFSTQDFHEQTWRNRSWYRQYAEKTPQPDQAIETFITHTALLDQAMEQQCAHSPFRSLITAGRMGIEESYTKVKSILGLI